jgi:predicted HTH transcriptional regulator
MDLVEKIGSGINRMKEAMLAANLPEPIFNLEGIFAITYTGQLNLSNGWNYGKISLVWISRIILTPPNPELFY